VAEQESDASRGPIQAVEAAAMADVEPSTPPQRARTCAWVEREEAPVQSITGWQFGQGESRRSFTENRSVPSWEAFAVANQSAYQVDSLRQ
jgi:hypothetical protein